MKKLLFVSLALAMLVGMPKVNAMSEADLKAKFDQAAANGIVIDDGTKKQIADYLDKYELTSEECDIIAKDVDKAIEIVKAENVTSLENLSASAKDKLKDLVTDVTTNTSVNATVTGGTVVVLNDDGTTFAEVSKIVKRTGNSNMTVVVAGVSFVVTLVGAYFVIRQVKAN